jgi:hypothetical protein
MIRDPMGASGQDERIIIFRLKRTKRDSERQG